MVALNHSVKICDHRVECMRSGGFHYLRDTTRQLRVGARAHGAPRECGGVLLTPLVNAMQLTDAVD